MIDYSSFLSTEEYRPWASEFADAIAKRAAPSRHGDLKNWLDCVASLPNIRAQEISLDQDLVTIGSQTEVSQSQSDQIFKFLFKLSPWRKGPYSIFGTFIDCEWRSDWKWQRIAPHIKPLTNAHVLDVGCGSGYHCWRMLGAGARRVLGIDPSMRFAVQHLAIQRFAQHPAFELVPIGIEDMPASLELFDTVFSMGVLYHRKDPLQHVKELVGHMRSGAQLVLETLIIDKDYAPSGIFTPRDRYAQMRNVWSITSIEKTLELMSQAGLNAPRCVDINVTSLNEQRRTDWMRFHSLKQFLDPHDITKTIEGYPAPKRGIFIAEKPSS